MSCKTNEIQYWCGVRPWHSNAQVSKELRWVIIVESGQECF